jgi:hypothetical protein
MNKGSSRSFYILRALAFGPAYEGEWITPRKTAPDNGFGGFTQSWGARFSTIPVDGSVHILYIDQLSDATAVEKVAMLKIAPAVSDIGSMCCQRSPMRKSIGTLSCLTGR